MPPLARLRRLAVWIAVPLAGLAAEPAVPPLQLEAFAPQPALVAFARGHGFTLEGVDAAAEGATRPGDAVTMLVTLRKAGVAPRQWIVEFTVATPTEKERTPDPKRSLTLHATSGRTFQFAAGANVALDIRSAGPFGDGIKAPVEVKPARATINPDLLAIGLDETSRTMLRLNAEHPATETAPGGKPVPITLPEAEERAMVGFVPALATLFQGIQDTPGLREILWEVAEKPSIWSIAKHFGRVDLNLNLDQNSAEAIEPRPDWAPRGAALYRLSPLLVLNDTPALRCSLFVTAPRPPLLTTAGVVGIAAAAPAGKARRVDIRILAARRGASE